MLRFPPALSHNSLVFLVLLLGIPSLCPGEIFTIDEDFSNTSRRDSLLTSAFWDTDGLNIHLYSQTLFARGSLNTTSAYSSVYGSSHLFLADGAAGLRSVDLNDPDLPVSADLVPCSDQARGVALAGDYAFVAAGSAGLQVIDISTPTAMTDQGYFDNGGDLNYLNAVAISQSGLFLAESGVGLAVFDISTPTSPSFVRHIDTGTWARDVCVSGNLLLVADDGFAIFDLSDPLDPAELSHTSVTGTALRISVTGSRAFVACGNSGLQIFDISDPANPLALGTVDLWDSCQHAVATTTADTVFVAASSEGFSLVEVSNPAEPEILGSYDTVAPAVHVLPHGDLIHLASSADGLKIFQLDPDGLDPLKNQAQSINLNDSGDPVSRILLSAAVNDSVAFELTADGGTTWHLAESGAGWFEFPTPGSDIRWRASLFETETSPTSGPACYNLSISMDRLASHATISAVADVADDAGLQVRLSWLASRHDTAGGEYEVTEYSLYRRFAANQLKATDPTTPYPPGQWDFITTIPADRETEYSTVVPTLADSTSSGIAWSVYFVRTRTTTSGVFFDSLPDSGYSVNNLRPAPPTGFLVDYSPSPGTQLSWNPTTDPNFAHFRVYRSLLPDTPTGPATLYAVTTETEFFDDTETYYYYQLTQVTLEGFESLPAGQLSAAPDNPPKVIQLANSPNPFNPRTTLSFLVTQDQIPLDLTIFDARGRKIRSLLGQTLPLGWHRITWDGRDQRGRACASGIYHARLAQNRNQSIIKMTLVR